MSNKMSFKVFLKVLSLKIKRYVKTEKSSKNSVFIPVFEY